MIHVIVCSSALCALSTAVGVADDAAPADEPTNRYQRRRQRLRPGFPVPVFAVIVVGERDFHVVLVLPGILRVGRHRSQTKERFPNRDGALPQQSAVSVDLREVLLIVACSAVRRIITIGALRRWQIQILLSALISAFPNNWSSV